MLVIKSTNMVTLKQVLLSKNDFYTHLKCNIMYSISAFMILV